MHIWFQRVMTCVRAESTSSTSLFALNSSTLKRRFPWLSLTMLSTNFIFFMYGESLSSEFLKIEPKH